MNSYELILTKRRGSKESARVQAEKVTGEVEKLKLHKLSLAFELSRLSKERKELLKKKEAAEEEKCQLSQKVESLEKVFVETGLSLRVSKDQLQSLNAAVEDLKVHLSILDFDIEAGAPVLNKLRWQLDEAQNKREIIQNEVEAKEKEISRIKEIQSNLILELEHSNLKLREFRQQKEQKLSEIEGLFGETFQLENACQKVRGELDKLQIELPQVEGKLGRQRKLHAAAQKAHKEVSLAADVYGKLLVEKQKALETTLKLKEELSIELGKLKEVEMLSSVALEHVKREEEVSAKRIVLLREKIEKKKSAVKEASLFLKDQQNLLEALQMKEKKFSEDDFLLTELLEKTRSVLKSNQQVINQVHLMNEEGTEVSPGLPDN